MHELSIANSLLEIACDQAAQHGAAGVSKISCRIGCLRQVDRLCLQEAFAIVRQGTAAKFAELTVTYGGMLLECRRCGHRVELEGWQFDCPKCRAADIKLSGGEELEITSLELQVPDEDRSPEKESVCQERPGRRGQPVAP